MKTRNWDQEIRLDKELQLWSGVDYAEWGSLSLDFPNHSDAVNSIILLLNSFLQEGWTLPFPISILCIWDTFRVLPWPWKKGIYTGLGISLQKADMAWNCLTQKKICSWSKAVVEALPTQICPQCNYHQDHIIFIWLQAFGDRNFGITWKTILVLELYSRTGSWSVQRWHVLQSKLDLWKECSAACAEWRTWPTVIF